MKLENRYFVVKRSDLSQGAIFGMSPAESCMLQLESIAEESRASRGAKALECIVIEKDWPEYELILKMLSDRVDAARYRWLRDNCQESPDAIGMEVQLYFGTYCGIEGLDAAVDAEMGDAK